MILFIAISSCNNTKLVDSIPHSISRKPTSVYKIQSACPSALPSHYNHSNKSTRQIASFDNNDIYIDKYEIAIGNNYRDIFFDEFVAKMGRI